MIAPLDDCPVCGKPFRLAFGTVSEGMARHYYWHMLEKLKEEGDKPIANV